MANFIALKIFNQSELDFIHKLYTIEKQVFHEPMWIIIDEENNNVSYELLSDLKDPIKEYNYHNFKIIDVKYLMRSEKLKRINTK